jgi:hypothetical protein
MSAVKSGSATTGLILIAVGVLFLIGQRVDLGGSVWFLGIGAVFLIVYLGTRNYGLLIPGAILLGLGAGDALGSTQLGLGLGFFAIFALDSLVYRAGAESGSKVSHWWPLIPAVVLIAGPLLDQLPDARRWVRDWWPLALIALGVLILVRGRRRSATE